MSNSTDAVVRACEQVMQARDAGRYSEALRLTDGFFKKHKNPIFLKIKGFMLMELLRFEEAQKVWTKLFALTPEAYAYYALCAILKGDPHAAFYLREAYARDKKKTKEILTRFFEEVIKPNPFVSEAQKTELQALLRGL